MPLYKTNLHVGILSQYIHEQFKADPAVQVDDLIINNLNKINTLIYPIDVDIYKRAIKAMLFYDPFADLADRIVEFENVISFNQIEDVFVDIDFKMDLMYLYLVKPMDYMEKIRPLSDEIKRLIVVRDDILSRVGLSGGII
jgi:hypothetical protein